MLIILSGLPGTGKTTIARELARRLNAVYVRIDSIEQAIKNAGLAMGPMNDAGYRVGCVIAEDNLRLGRTVITDSVNAIQVARDQWMNVAGNARHKAFEIEIQCSDAAEHRRRVEARVADVSGHRLPTWDEISTLDYHSWNREHLVVDTASLSPAQAVSLIVSEIDKLSAN
jgi:predicted kinase